MFTPTQLLPFFQRYPAATYWLAYSGGLDSQVLLHACAQLRLQQPQLTIKAIHIDHGLQAISATWVTHCQTSCEQWAIPLTVESLHLSVVTGESLEAVAREARYAAFGRYMQSDDVLFTAHHQDDQAETVLLHLLRGSGVDGLAAMPESRRLAQGWLVRPLLAVSRADLLAYAEQYALTYVQDPTNEQTRFERNFLRQTILPLLSQRWPSVHKTLARVAQLQSENRALVAELLEEKLPLIRGQQPYTLSIATLLKQSLPVQKALLRLWLSEQGFLFPDAKQLQQVLLLLHARTDATPCVTWKGCEIRRYRDDLYAMSPLSKHDASQVLAWDITQPLTIESLDLSLTPELLGRWLNVLQTKPQPVSVRFRQGGEVMWMPYRAGHHSVKHLMQEAGISPWQRERLPLIYIGERLVSIVGLVHVNPDENE